MYTAGQRSQSATAIQSVSIVGYVHVITLPWEVVSTGGFREGPIGAMTLPSYRLQKISDTSPVGLEYHTHAVVDLAQPRTPLGSLQRSPCRLLSWIWGLAALWRGRWEELKTEEGFEGQGKS